MSFYGLRRHRQCFPDARGRAALFLAFGPELLRHYPREITFLPVVATSSFRPYLETSPGRCSVSLSFFLSRSGEGTIFAPRKSDEGDGSPRSRPARPRVPAKARRRCDRKREKERDRRPSSERQRDRDEVVKSVGRLKIIQGSALRADALAALTCPHLSAYYVPITSRYLDRPRTKRSATTVRGSHRRGLWNRLSACVSLSLSLFFFSSAPRDCEQSYMVKPTSRSHIARQGDTLPTCTERKKLSI